MTIAIEAVSFSAAETTCRGELSSGADIRAISGNGSPIGGDFPVGVAIAEWEADYRGDRLCTKTEQDGARPHRT